MLAALENRLMAVLASGLASRSHTRVRRTPASPAPGEGSVVATLATLEPAPAFEREHFALGTSTSQSTAVRRVATVHLQLRLDISVAPPTPDAAGSAQARNLALDDLALLIHMLDQAEFRSGRAFSPDVPDPGFVVHEFQFEKATVSAVAPAAEALFRLRADFWPVNTAQDSGLIQRIQQQTELRPAPAEGGP